MTDSTTFHDQETEQAADDAKVNPEDGQDFGHEYAPLDPSTHENDPSLSVEEKKDRRDGKAYVDTSASQRTSDTDDESKDWTVQTTDEDDTPVALTEKLGEPGQRFRWEELPHAESVEKWGVDSDAWPKSLPLHESAEEKVYADEKAEKNEEKSSNKK